MFDNRKRSIGLSAHFESPVDRQKERQNEEEGPELKRVNLASIPGPRTWPTRFSHGAKERRRAKSRDALKPMEAGYCLHCPLFLRSAIVIWHAELHVWMLVPTFPLQALFMQAWTSQLTAASAEGAKTTDNP
jgi:hypothetical protein